MPAPAIMPPNFTVFPEATSMVPFPVKAMPRLLLRGLILLVTARVPPLNTMLPGVATPGAAPRLRSELMLNMPLVMVVGVV